MTMMMTTTATMTMTSAVQPSQVRVGRGTWQSAAAPQLQCKSCFFFQLLCKLVSSPLVLCPLLCPLPLSSVCVCVCIYICTRSVCICVYLSVCVYLCVCVQPSVCVLLYDSTLGASTNTRHYLSFSSWCWCRWFTTATAGELGPEPGLCIWDNWSQFWNDLFGLWETYFGIKSERKSIWQKKSFCGLPTGSGVNAAGGQNRLQPPNWQS